MKQALKELEKLRMDINDDALMFSEEKLDIIEKALKALEIIKSKEILSVFKSITEYYYLLANTTAIEITEEEYDLLKEVLMKGE